MLFKLCKYNDDDNGNEDSFNRKNCSILLKKHLNNVCDKHYLLKEMLEIKNGGKSQIESIIQVSDYVNNVESKMLFNYCYIKII